MNILDRAICFKIIEKLEENYKGEGTALLFHSPFELLVSVILSAQCTDKRVNIITRGLFKKYKTPQDYITLGQAKLEELIKSCGCFRVKANNIIETSKTLIKDFGGRVPDTMEELLRLKGVGRKTANVVLYNAFSKNAIAVDTHVFRVSLRLGLSSAKTPDGVEKDLNRLIPEDKWGAAHHWLIWHGRRVCRARRPLCPGCFLNGLCPFYNKMKA